MIEDYHLKTFAISKLVFSATMLPLPANFYFKIEKIIYNFFWGKQDKIRRSLICDHIDGGINMIDIESFFLSLKATWIHRFLNGNGLWNHIPNYYMNILAPLNVITKMSFERLQDISEINILPAFYQEILLSFCKSKNIDTFENKEQFFSQLLWGNRLLKYKDKCLFSKHMIEAGLLYVKDIINADGTFKLNIYERLINKMNYFRDRTILGKVIRGYNKYFNAFEMPHIEIDNNMNFENKSKYYYLNLKKHKELTPKCLNSWKLEFNDFTFKQVYLNKIKPMHIAKVREFIFKIIHHICVCKSNLFKWKMAISNKCIYCNGIQTIKHLIWECQNVHTFWNNLQDKLHIEITYKTLILGDKDKNKNNLLSIIMYSIYKKFIMDINENNTQPLQNFILHELIVKSEIYNQISSTSEIYVPLRMAINVL